MWSLDNEKGEKLDSALQLSEGVQCSNVSISLITARIRRLGEGNFVCFKATKFIAIYCRNLCSCRMDMDFLVPENVVLLLPIPKNVEEALESWNG